MGIIKDIFNRKMLHEMKYVCGVFTFLVLFAVLLVVGFGGPAAVMTFLGK